jgi:hypothetical protein
LVADDPGVAAPDADTVVETGGLQFLQAPYRAAACSSDISIFERDRELQEAR